MRRKPTPPPEQAAAPTNPTVGAADLLDVLNYRRQVTSLGEQLRTANALLAEAENHVILLLKAGAEVTSPQHTACVLVEEGAVVPKWKEEFLSHMETSHQASRAACESEVRTRYKPSISERLVITHRTIKKA